MPLKTKRRVLTLEDEPQTISAVVEQLRLAGVVVVQASDVIQAEQEVASTVFDLLLVDLRVPRDGAWGHLDEGQLFVERLKRGEHGELNVRSPFVMLTAFKYDVEYDSLVDLPGYGGVVPKPESVVRDLASRLSGMCPWFSEIGHIDESSYVVDDLVVFDGYERNGYFDVLVPSWPGRQTVPVSSVDLPDSVVQELDFGYRPVLAWASVNIAAEEASFVRPHNFRISSFSESELRAFDEMPPGYGEAGQGGR